VFLLNAILTVAARQPASHRDIGRDRFTDAVIRTISEQKQGVIILLRGNFAKQKKALIDTTKHIVLEAAHPSPFSAHKGFFGCKHFSTTNQLLEMQGKEPILWL
jgi:uracil-DNA glycosylase